MTRSIYRFTDIHSVDEREKMLSFCQFMGLTVIFLNLDFSIIDFNDHAQRIYGWEKERILHTSFIEWCEEHNIISPITADDILSLLKGVPVLSIENLLPNKQGAMSWDIICNTDMHQKVDSIVLIGKIIPSIKNHRLLVEKLQPLYKPNNLTSRKGILLEDIIYGMPGIVFWKDINFIYLGCNDLTANLLNLPSRYDIVGKTDYDFGWEKEVVDECRKIDERILATGQPARDIEETMFFPKQGNITFIANKMPLYNEHNEIIGIIGINIDITARKEAETALAIAKQAAETANKAKSNFIGNMSHDIKTPLAGIVGIAEYLAYTLKNKKNIDLACKVQEAGQQLMLFIDNCLESAKIEDTEITKKKECFNLELLLSEVMALYQPAVKNKGLLLSSYYDEKASKLFLGPRAAIFRILMNLIGNAIKFTKVGSVAIHVSAGEKSTPSTSIVKICVADTGIGIPQDKHIEVFERFIRLEPSNKGITTGSGLGLFLVKTMVEAMHGEVYLQSEEGRGSQFTVVLPLDISLLAENEHAENKMIYPINRVAELNSKDKLNVRKTSSKLQVLLIEDSNIVLRVTALMLASFNCEVDVAENGEKALKLFKEGKYDLVFMDLGLPDLSGYEIAIQFRQTERNTTHRVPIIALSAHVTEEITQECLDKGMDQVLSKPLSMEEAKSLIDYYASVVSYG
ncbi:MAG: two component system histidine kinase [Gammaproteobacteria bacterium]|jgi:signal transduction histidine kinase/CheY-like chemotaxis protein|nr:two component system histidine kinase [Gammaproteobacteria bacterium]